MKYDTHNTIKRSPAKPIKSMIFSADFHSSSCDARSMYAKVHLTCASRYSSETLLESVRSLKNGLQYQSYSSFALLEKKHQSCHKCESHLAAGCERHQISTTETHLKYEYSKPEFVRSMIQKITKQHFTMTQNTILLNHSFGGLSPPNGPCR